MKFLKKKKYSILLNIFRYSFVGVIGLALILPTLFINDFAKIKIVSASGPVITTSNLTNLTVTLNASGLTPNTNVVIQIDDFGEQTPHYFSSKLLKSNASGLASFSFTGLSPGGEYRGGVGYTGTANLVADIIFTTSTTAPIVKITNFNPKSGKVGDSITITGENFTGVTEVFFNNTKAIPKTSNSSTITVDVPTGATSGPIKIKNITTATDFEVLTNGNTTTTNTETNNETSVNEYNEVEFNGLVPVCNTGEVDPVTGNYKNHCDFNMVMALINKVINFLLIVLATPLFALITIYVGWLYLSDMGSTENVKKAKKIFKNVFIGYIIALAAWLIVKTILVTVGFDPQKAFLSV